MAGLPEEWHMFEERPGFASRRPGEICFKNGKCGAQLDTHAFIDFDLGIPAKLRIRSEELRQHGRILFAAHPSIVRVELTTTPHGEQDNVGMLDAEFRTADGKSAQVAEWKMPI